MTIFQAIILGIVQGITEFLPISSSGHLIFIPQLLGWETQSLAFDAFIHLGTLGAVFYFFREEVKKMFFGLFKKDSEWGRLAWWIIFATIPVVIIALLFRDSIETSLRSPYVVAGSLFIWGLVLYIADRLSKKKAIKDIETIGWKKSLFIGFAQAIALIPGTSRSGITMTAGLFAGLSRDAAARFSFLLGIPAIAGAGVLSFKDLLETGDTSYAIMAAGFISSFLAGLFAISILLKLLKAGSFRGFALYRVALSLAILVFFLGV